MDVCAGHGVWLDAGELKQIQEWTALGGKHNVLKDELDDKHRYNRAKERKRHNAHRKSHYDHDPVADTDGLTDAIEMISSFFRFGRF